MMEVVEETEKQLLFLLMENTCGNPCKTSGRQSENGPQIDPKGTNVMASQSQVDDLLDELGF